MSPRRGEPMELNELQKFSTEIIERIDKKMGRDHNVDLTMLHTVEEIGELARLLYNEKTGRASVSKQALGGEFADILMLLLHLASKYDISAEEAIAEKAKELKERFQI
jgi:NTP pyrophosphatase (non-canonical NTP hydrolase)